MAGIIVAVFFGVSFMMTQKGLAKMPPMVLISYRFTVAAIILTILKCLRLVQIDYKGKPVGGVILLSVFYPGIAFFFETIGLTYVSSSQAGILVSIMPIFVTIFGVFILKERPAKIQIMFIVISVIGVLVTIIFAKNQGNHGTFFGILLMLISVVGGALNNVLSRKYSKYFTPVEITYMMLWTGAVIFNVIAIIQGIGTKEVLAAYCIPFQSMEIMLVVLEISIGTSVVAFFCMNYMLANLKAANASVFFNLATVISIIAGVIIMRERLYWYQMIGGFCIIVSVWGTNYYENREIKVKEEG